MNIWKSLKNIRSASDRPYLILIIILSITAGLMVGVQIATIQRQYKREQVNFKEEVERSIRQAQLVYQTWNSHVSNVESRGSFTELYYNEDSTFAFMSAQTSQIYPLLDFKPDTNLPSRRAQQFQEFRKELEKTSSPKKSGVQEFYIFRLIQYCKDCTEKQKSLSQIFPLDSLIRTSLKDREIQSPVEIAFYNLETQSYFPESVSSQAFKKSPFKIPFSPGEEVHLIFPQQALALASQLALPIIASLVLMLISLGGFWLSLRIILRQKKHSELKNDFINNVSHEFKTPIATIAFAVANLENARVLENPQEILQFSQVIKDENQRLNTQVEKVLQSSLSHAQALKLKKEKVNLHVLINQLVDAYEIKVKARGGGVQRRLNAAQAEISGDPFHLSNALSNLMDNALKYSRDRLEIQVRTQSDSQGIYFYIQDQGLGIAKEDQKYIFDKFYRVPQGNLHEVKGFGLGLSYVKDIVERHGGKLQLQSKLGQGSTFYFFLPFKPTSI